MQQTTSIAAGAPAWVYVLLIVLIALGVRRLRTREVPVGVALLPFAAFLIWSLVGLWSFAALAGWTLALGAWTAGASIGVITAIVVPEPRGERLPDRRVRLPATVLPLILYLGVFVTRFACGAWAALVPARAITATAIGLAIGAAMTARLIVAVARWRPVPDPYGAS